ncbi:tRNA dihydrouridine synthase DusB [Porticoccus sp.]
MVTIGNHVLASRTILAPMAGVTDRPFRQLCKRLGAGMTVSEMVTSDTSLWHTRKSQLRLPHEDEPTPKSVQIAGSIPEMMAEAARQNFLLGAEIIDINMGCPAKKVCKRAAGSALLKDEVLVEDILCAVVNAVPVPVTLKIRTGWDTESRNAVQIARIAENSGIQAIAVHGRTRACRFKGDAEYDTIAEVVASVDIPVFANGDIRSPEQARLVLEHTGADAVMIGRGAQGNPWLFREINHYLETGTLLAAPTTEERISVISEHLQAIHEHYGDYLGTRIARKHIGWYVDSLPSGETFRKYFNLLDTPSQQQQSLKLFLTRQEEWDTAA